MLSIQTPDECNARRQTWSEGEWVTLSDRKRWSVPLLSVSPGPPGLPDVWSANGRPQSIEFGLTMWTYGRTISDPATHWRYGRALRSALVGTLLGCNYHLTADQATELTLVGFDRRNDLDGLELAMARLRDTALQALWTLQPPIADPAPVKPKAARRSKTRTGHR